MQSAGTRKEVEQVSRKQEVINGHYLLCLLYTSDAADDAHGVDLGGRRIIKKKFF